MRKIGLNISTTYNPMDYKPFDTRQLVEKYADLVNLNTWITSGENFAYNGMIVAVGGHANMTETDLSKVSIYYLFDPLNTDPDNDYPDVTKEENWHKLCEWSELNTLESRIEELENIEVIPGVSIEEVNAAVEQLRQEVLNAGYITEAMLSEYGFAESSDLDQVLSDAKAYTDDITNTLVDTDTFNSALSDLVTDDDLSDALSTINNEMSQKAAVADVNALSATVSSLETSVANKADSSTLDSYYTKDEVDQKIAGAGNGDIDLDSYAKASDLNALESTVDALNTTIGQMSEKVSAIEDIDITIIHGGSAKKN